jgi:formylglycine-generating enzyme required for sulfatase activity
MRIAAMIAWGFALTLLGGGASQADSRAALLIGDGKIAVVSHAGHGMKVNGTSHPVPSDVRLEHDIDVEDDAVPLDRVSQLVAPRAGSSGPCGGGSVTGSLSSRVPCPLAAAEERSLKPQDIFKECDKCPEMVVVPAGTFTMGSPQDEEGRFSDEGPQHGVTIAQQFAVGRFAVTFDEWDACVADGGCNGYKPDDHGWGRGRRPVIDVAWDNVKAYLAWLSRETGKTYRLLSEAEREYVTRAGTSTPFWWGTSISTTQANYDGSSTYGGGSKGETRFQTVPVDSFSPNPWGLYQVHGNVLELVEDCYHGSYAGAPSTGSAWTSGDCSRRVLRGGFWDSDAWGVRAAARNRNISGVRGFGVGFRVAKTLAP